MYKHLGQGWKRQPRWLGQSSRRLVLTLLILLGLPNPGTPLAKCCKILAGSPGSSLHPGEVCQGVWRQEGKGPSLACLKLGALPLAILRGVALDRPDRVGSQGLLANQLARARLRERLVWHYTKPRFGARARGVRMVPGVPIWDTACLGYGGLRRGLLSWGHQLLE